jgi:DNA repair protein SbcC/Rad50
MLLKQIKLQNIRSYIEQTIDFSPGSILLSGDIGSGKSTILLAIEFALFGTSRSDLPGEILLRKGSSQSSVELTFVLNEQEITIKRVLKKDKDTVKQLAGHIVINNVKKDLTPVELKAEIVSLLGYPEEFITKSKNFIFRYTVYTPQEEMKFILQENQEVRLDVLRKIFNVDKYKNVRENLQFYLKQMRTNIAIFKTKIEPLDEFKQELKELIEEKKETSQVLDKLTPHLREVKEKLVLKRSGLINIEEKQKHHHNIKQQYKTALALVNEKSGQIELLKRKREELNLEISKFDSIDHEKYDKIKQDLLELEKQRGSVYTKKSFLQEKTNNLQQQIISFQEEIVKIEQQANLIKEKEVQKQELAVELAEKENLKQKKTQLEELFEKTSALVTKNHTLLSQSRELQQKINAIDNCPTCLQIVSEQHKCNIIKQEDDKIKQAENLLFELNKKKSQIYDQKELTKNQIEELIRKENFLTRIKLELIQLGEKRDNLGKKKEQLKSWAQENNHYMQLLQELEKENQIEMITTRIKEGQEFLNSYSKVKLLEKQSFDLNEQIKRGQEQVKNLHEKISLFEQELSEGKDFSSEIESRRKELDMHLQEEKELSVKQAQLQTQLNNLVKQEDKVTKNIDELNKLSHKLFQLKELYHWIDAHFLKLTYTIEKQVMLSIHRLFNQLFQEWFSMLIDDENIYSRLDDSFTPVIEQNGYEISFNSLSGGEKTSASLAYRLALNKVINDVVGQIKTKDLLILDEPTDGFSSEQLDKVRDVLDKLGLRQVVIVSHESKIESFVESVVRVNKRGHVSEVF